MTMRKGKLFPKIFKLVSTKRIRVFSLASFFVFIGVFVFIQPSHATVSGLVLSIVGAFVEFWVFLMGQLIALVTYVLIAIANYNNFTDSEAIRTGWVIVRDVANMFFVVVFLIIAFGTILGERLAQNYHYKKALPRLLIMAILINFSKTIAGLFIDFSQVIMLTFVNGFSQAAGGNFLEVLQIDQLTALRTLPADPATGDTPTTTHADAVAGLLLAGAVATLSVVVMVIMTMVLAMRMVMLWLLVVVSPLTFFASTVPSKKINQQYYTWWDNFIAELAIGPVLAFFIWLSLAVTSSVGNEAADIAAGATPEDVVITGEGTGEGAGGSVSSIQSGIGDESNMIKYIIGIGMLIGGLIMAKQTGAAGSGLAGAGLGFVKSQTVGVAKGAAKWAGRKGWGAATAPGRAAVGLARDKYDAGMGKVYGSLAKSGIPLVSGFGAKRASEIRGRRQQIAGKAAESIKSLNLDEAVGFKKSLERMPVQSEETKAKIDLANKKILSGTKFEGEKAYDKKTGKLVRDNKKEAQSALKGLQDRAEETGDDSYYETVNGFKQARPDMLEQKDMEGTLAGMSALQIAQKVGLKAFNSESKGGKQFLGHLSKDPKLWDSVHKSSGLEQRRQMDQYQEGLTESQKLNPESSVYEKDATKRKKLIQEMSQEQIAEMAPEAVTGENVAMMSNLQLGSLVEAGKMNADALDSSSLKNAAIHIAQHGSDELKDETQKKFGKEYVEALQLDRDKHAGSEANTTGETYNGAALGAAKAVLGAGGGVYKAFNADSSKGTFKEPHDRQAFYDATSEEKGGDPKLLLKLKPEDLRGPVGAVAARAAYDPAVLRQLANNAKSPDQKEVFEKIVQSVYERSGNIADSDMTRYIDGSSRFRKHIPRDMKTATRQKAEDVRASATAKEAEVERQKEAKRQAAREAAREEQRVKWQARREKAKVVKRKRPMRKAVPGGVGEEREKLVSEAVEGGKAARERKIKKGKAMSAVERAIKEGLLEDESGKDQGVRDQLAKLEKDLEAVKRIRSKKKRARKKVTKSTKELEEKIKELRDKLS